MAHKKSVINKEVKKYIKMKKKDSLDWPGDNEMPLTKRQLTIAMIHYIIGELPFRGLRGCCRQTGISKSTLSRYFDMYAFSVNDTLASLLFARMYYNKKQLYDISEKIGITNFDEATLRALNKWLNSHKLLKPNTVSDRVESFISTTNLKELF